MGDDYNSITGIDKAASYDVGQHAFIPDQYKASIDAGHSPDEAGKLLVDAYKEAGMDLDIITVNDARAFITSTPSTNEVTVSFDPNVNAYNKFWGADHPLGGEAYSSIMGTMKEENENGLFIDQVKESIKGASNKIDGPVDLRLTGFSKAGGMALSATGWLMSERFFDENPDIRPESIHTFGSFPSTDQEFNDNFSKEADRLGIDIVRVSGGDGDETPTYFTDDAPAFMKPPFVEYEHIGSNLDLTGVTEHSMASYLQELSELQSPSASTSPTHPEPTEMDNAAIPSSPSAAPLSM